MNKIGFYVSVKNGLFESVMEMTTEIISEYADARLQAQQLRNNLIADGYKEAKASDLIKDGESLPSVSTLKRVVSIAVWVISYTEIDGFKFHNCEKIIFDLGYYVKSAQ